LTADTSREHASSYADTRLLQVVHRTLRLATTRIVDATEKLEPSVLKPVIGPAWQFYAAVLHHHHHTEDTAAFPALVAVRPDMGALAEELETDHKNLVTALEAAQRAVTAFDSRPDVATQRDMHEAVAAVRDEFFPHLDVEDTKVIPVFAEAIPAKDWDRMENEALKSIPRPHLPKAVGALDEVVRSTPDAERPPAPPLPIRIMLAVSWRRQWAEFVKPLTV